MYKLEILASAREEILDIAQLHLELGGSASTRKITAKIKESLEHLRTHPQMGTALTGKDLTQKGYRKLVCGNYLCFYRLIGDTVFVYHIADGGTEYKRLFHPRL
jgi:plasmid stabilization system protein ParE